MLPVLPPCRYGSMCYRQNLAHRQQFSHPATALAPTFPHTTDPMSTSSATTTTPTPVALKTVALPSTGVAVPGSVLAGPVSAEGHHGAFGLAPAAVPAPLPAGVALWEWMDPSGTWIAYEHMANERLEANYKHGLPVLLTLGTARYLIDFNSMSQENTKTGFKRKVRRREGAGLPPEMVWVWLDATSQRWLRYDPEVEKVLEAAFGVHKSASVDHLGSATAGYEICFGKSMYQLNVKTGFRRPIRRVTPQVAKDITSAVPAAATLHLPHSHHLHHHGFAEHKTMSRFGLGSGFDEEDDDDEGDDEGEDDEDDEEDEEDEEEEEKEEKEEGVPRALKRRRSSSSSALSSSSFVSTTSTSSATLSSTTTSSTVDSSSSSSSSSSCASPSSSSSSSSSTDSTTTTTTTAPSSPTSSSHTIIDPATPSATTSTTSMTTHTTPSSSPAAPSTPSASPPPHVVDDDRTCVVCLVDPKTILCKPCCHVCLCEACAASANFTKKKARCPLCRKRIKALLKVYL